jgi:putative lipoprotein
MTRRRISRRAALAMLAALPVAGCGAGRWFGEKVPDGTVTGTVAWREPLALPPGATLVVRLEELARPGASPVLIAEQTMETRCCLSIYLTADLSRYLVMGVERSPG